MRFHVGMIAGMGAIVVCLLVGCGGQPPQDDGKVIKIGNTMPYSGPASAYGTIGKAIAAYFKKVNAEGGVNGRSIEFISLDDGYSPPKTKEQTRKLVEREKVLFMMGSLGTAANSAVQEYLNRRGVPQLFVSTGATKWGQPEVFPWTMGWQPSYATESRLFGQYILKHHPDATIAILYQNDDYGKDYVHGLRETLGDRAEAMIVAEQSYETSDPTVDAQLLQLRASGATLFYNITTPKFAAQAIKKLDELQWQPIHLLNSISASITSVLEPAGADRSKGIITLGYYKDPKNPGMAQDPAFQEWSAWMQNYYPDGDPGDSFNVYGYLVGQTVVHILERAGDDLSRENIMKLAADIKGLHLGMLLPGIDINTAGEDYFPIEKMQPSVFNGVYMDRLDEIVVLDP